MADQDFDELVIALGCKNAGAMRDHPIEDAEVPKVEAQPNRGGDGSVHDGCRTGCAAHQNRFGQ